MFYFEGELALPDYLSALNILKEYLIDNDKIYILTTQHKRFRFEKETWNYIKSEFKQFSMITAQAIVLDELHLRLLAKFYLKLVKNTSPTKIFRSEKEGLKWLKDQENNSKSNLILNLAI